MCKNKKKKNTSVKTPTVGQLARELLLKQDKHMPTPNEASKEQLSDYDKHLEECVETHKKKFPDDFYVVILTKKERLLKNVLRSYFFGRLSCPTPDYDQVVYKYHRKEEKLDFLWVIPDRSTCHLMATGATGINPSEWDLLSYVLKFRDGSLFRLAKKLNNEKEDSIEIVKGS